VTASPNSSPTPAPSALKILVAEDEGVSRMLIEALLKRAGLDPVIVTNGTDAWAELQRAEYSVLISDYQMPGLDGFELVRRLRAAQFRHYTYVILLTAKGGKSNHLEAIHAGADDFVTKPFDADLLFARLHVAERILGLQHHVKQLEGLLHICAQCKRIRDENKDWTQLERYITAHSNVLFSHGLCPDCAAAWERQMESMK